MQIKIRKYTISKLERKKVMDLRCLGLGCGALLGKQINCPTVNEVSDRTIQIKCRKCKSLNLFKLT